MVVSHLQSYLVTLPDTTSAEKLFSVEYYLPVYFGENVEVTLKIIQQLSDKVKSVELSVSISTEYYIKYCIKAKESTLSSRSGLQFGHCKAAELLKRFML